MVVYIKHEGKLKTFQDLAIEYNVHSNLIYSRYKRGIRDMEKLTAPKYDSYNDDKEKSS